MLKNKMTSCNEFFNRLRKLAFSVDRETNGLKEALENSEVTTYDENRACLLLRETLAEVKDLKKEINAKIEDSHQQCTFEEFISACSRIVSQTKEQINELEDHLVKYGYTKSMGNLPDLTKVGTSLPGGNGSVAVDTAVSSEQSDSGDDVTFEKTSGTEESIPMETNQPDQISSKDNVEDILKTPEPPVTFTKMIEVTPQRSHDTKDKVLTDTEMMSCSTPEAPQTNTPMIKPRLLVESTESPISINSTPQGFLVPPQPVTVTPMLKHADLVAVTPPGLSKGQEYPDLPAPPIMGTPGFKTIVPTGKESPVIGLELSFSLDSLPPPPDITSVQLLKPDDIAAPIQSNHLAVFVQPLSEQEYSSLPVYVANQFTLECINQHLHTINGFLAGGNQVRHEPVMVEQDLRDLLNLGAATKAFMLVLVKTGRLKLTGKKIMFVNSA